MIKYPSINQFRNVIKDVKTRHDYKGKDENGNPVYSHDTPYPTLTFEGRVKLHGTNAAVVQYKDRREFQSRERVLSIGNDNAGFALAMSSKDLDFLFEGIDFKESIAVFGEWCGGNIQKGVALNGLPKMFVVFGCLVDGEWNSWALNAEDFSVDEHEQGLYHIDEFANYLIEIDMNNPEAVQNTLINWTLEVEEECPVGKYFGVKGIGEGIVFTCREYPDLKFKSKGEKHSSSKVKVLNPVDTEELESIQEFVNYAVTENRLQQGLDTLKSNGVEISQKSTGEFLQWMFKDILKEEEDTIIANQINIKKANGAIAQKARAWYLSQI